MYIYSKWGILDIIVNIGYRIESQSPVHVLTLTTVKFNTVHDIKVHLL